MTSLTAAAEQAGWDPPATLTAVLVPEAQVRPTVAALDARTLRIAGDVTGEATGTDAGAILLVPDAAGPRRAALLEALARRDAVVGPAGPWTAAAVLGAPGPARPEH